jgi:hypothetical protein
LRQGCDFEIDVVERRIKLVYGLQTEVFALNDIARIVADPLFVQIQGNGFRVINLFVFALIKDSAQVIALLDGDFASGCTDLACTPFAVSIHSTPSSATAGAARRSRRLRIPKTTSRTVIASMAISFVLCIRYFISYLNYLVRTLVLRGAE